ncbi:ribonucleoside-diphosphate reductase alpha chain [Dyella sp. OK004]|uniref:hypothetical protein n=1 Tax=Dyella sp. OK004 TaxID=1855292 RepID=UPI0008ED85C2|nr:hypothetical protein [Dyella sp. OK004]SFS13986.1 ribonucleoside-diphosphate reductase alpha chain [Dyella sp. OK004]
MWLKSLAGGRLILAGKFIVRVAMRHSSPFKDIIAVEAWDAWFRWREEGYLRDLSIHDTWSRIARLLSTAEPRDQAAAFERRMIEASESWRLLLDERIIVSAGTAKPDWPGDGLAAVLNAASFVCAPYSDDACFEHEPFEAVAALAVHALDNACCMADQSGGQAHTHLRIGVMGLADAMAMLQLPYDSAAGRRFAHDVARSLAIGCLHGSLRMACDRGDAHSLSACPAQQHKLQAQPAELLRDVQRHGLRHQRLTTIEPQRRIALLANNIADAVDPLLAHGYAHTIADAYTTRSICSSGYAINLAKHLNAHGALTALFKELAILSPEAQLALRAAMQAWIDYPMDYLLAQSVPSETLSAVAALRPTQERIDPRQYGPRYRA